MITAWQKAEGLPVSQDGLLSFRSAGGGSKWAPHSNHAFSGGVLIECQAKRPPCIATDLRRFARQEHNASGIPKRRRYPTTKPVASLSSLTFAPRWEQSKWGAVES